MFHHMHLHRYMVHKPLLFNVTAAKWSHISSSTQSEESFEEPFYSLLCQAVQFWIKCNVHITVCCDVKQKQTILLNVLTVKLWMKYSVHCMQLMCLECVVLLSVTGSRGGNKKTDKSSRAHIKEKENDKKWKTSMKLFSNSLLRLYYSNLSVMYWKIYNPTVEFHPCVLFLFMKCNLIAGLHASTELIFQAAWCGMVMSET